MARLASMKPGYGPAPCTDRAIFENYLEESRKRARAEGGFPWVLEEDNAVQKANLR